MLALIEGAELCVHGENKVMMMMINHSVLIQLLS